MAAIYSTGVNYLGLPAGRGAHRLRGRAAGGVCRSSGVGIGGGPDPRRDGSDRSLGRNSRARRCVGTRRERTVVTRCGRPLRAKRYSSAITGQSL